jgi:hypothetical protein
VAGTTVEGAALASVSLVVVGTDNHCVSGNDRLGRCSGLCSLGRRGSSQPLWWRARKVRALLWSLFALSAWDQRATVEAGKTGEGAALASVRLVVVRTVSHCGCGHDR